MRAPVLKMWRRRWPTTTGPMLMAVVMVFCSLAPGTLTAPAEDHSLEDTARVLRHFTAGVGTRRGAGSGRQAGHTHGSFRGHQSFRARLDSLEVPDIDDPRSLERESLEISVGASAVPAGGTSGSQGFSSQYFVVGDDQSIEFDDDDFRYMNLGRRYHPDDIAPTSPQQLFIPQPAIPPTSTGSAASRFAPPFNNPFIVATASSGEDSAEDNPYEDDEDDDIMTYISKSLINVRGEDSSEERLILDDSILSKRYHFIDGQGSQRWGYELEDQYREQEVNAEDGTMKGRFGWTAPNGQEVKVQFVADDGGYRLIDSYGIQPMDSEDVHKLKTEHAISHHNAANRRPVAPLPPPVSVGVPLPPVDDKSYRVTIPFGGAGVPLPPPQSDISPFRGSAGFSGVGVPLPPQRGPGSTRFGVPLPTQTATGAVPAGRPTGGVPLPSPSGSPGAGFFGDDDTVVIGTTGGVPLPGMSGTRTGAGAGGVPLPAPSGPGQFPTGGVALPEIPGTRTGGVPLPPPSGPGTPGAGFIGDDDTIVAGTTGGVPLPGMPGITAGAGGVPLPPPSGPGTPGAGFIGDDDTVVAGTTGGVALPGMPGIAHGTGGVPLPTPSRPETAGTGFIGSDDTIVVGATGGVALPGMPQAGTGAVGVPLPTPSGPGSFPGAGFTGDDETIAIGATGGVALPGAGVEAGVGGVPLPTPFEPEAARPGLGFTGDDDTIIAGTTGGVALPGMPGIGAGGVPLPSPTAPEAGFPGVGFSGSDDVVIAGTTGGVPLPGMPETAAGVPLPTPSGPGATRTGFTVDDATGVVGGVALPGMPEAGVSGVPLPSPSRPGAASPDVGFSGGEDTIVAGTVGGVALPGVPGSGTSGVPLPAPSRPGAESSGVMLSEGDDTGVVGVTGGVPLRGMSEAGDGGVALPVPSGPGAAFPGMGLTGSDETVSVGATGGVPLSVMLGEEVSGVTLPMPSGPSTPGISSDEDILLPVTNGAAGLPGSPEIETTKISFVTPVGPTSGGVPLPGLSGSETMPSRPGFSDAGETVSVESSIGTSHHGMTGFAAGGVPLPSPSIPDRAPSGSGLFDFDEAGVRGDGGVELPGMTRVRTSDVSIPSPVGPGTGGVPLPSDFGTGTLPAGSDFGVDSTVIGATGGVGLPQIPKAGTGEFSLSSQIGSETSGVSLPTSSILVEAGEVPGTAPAFGASGAGDGVSGSGTRGGVALPGLGSSDNNGNGRPSFNDLNNGFRASGAAGGPGFDDSTISLSASRPEFNGGGVPLSVIGPADNRPMITGPNGEFGFSGSIGSSDNMAQGSVGSGSVVGVPLNSGFGGSARFSGIPGISPPEFGRGALDASEVPLQGPPISDSFSISTNLGQGSQSFGVPLNTGKSLSFNKSPSFHGTQFFEVGPPEPVQHAAGGPSHASPSSFHPHSIKSDSRFPNKIYLPTGPVFGSSLIPRSSSNLAIESDKPQDLVKVYHDIYGIEMREDDWPASRG